MTAGYDDTPETDTAWPKPARHWSDDPHRSAQYQTLRKQFRRQCQLTRNPDGSYGLPCWRCNQLIDYRLSFPHPGSFSVDHSSPVRTHPHLALDPNNFRPAHLRHNQEAGSAGGYGGTDDDISELDLGEPSERW
jgi:hypothetical protein